MEKKEDEESGSEDSEMEDDVGPTDEEINEIFLKRYKMSKEELQGMADKMGIQLNNLCYLKQETRTDELDLEIDLYIYKYIYIERLVLLPTNELTNSLAVTS